MPRNGPSDLDITVATQRRAQIMRAVMSSIADEGLERTTMRNVAERAGVSTGTIAYYFKSKKEMVDAALLEASQRYMESFYQTKQLGEPWSLDSLVEGFLAPDNADAGFVLQMIEVGLHNSELRGTHQWMIETGRANIEKSIRQGQESGRFRQDVDPRLAAALVHGVLVWWGSELMSNATSQDLARGVGKLALRLLEGPSEDQPGGTSRVRSGSAASSTLEDIRSLLAADANLPRRSAEALADAIDGLYEAFRTES